MEIKYITNVRIPTSRAHGFAIMKMCEKFAENGAAVELIVPNRRNNEKKENPFVYYDIKDNFNISRLRSFDLLGPFESFGRLFYWIDLLSFFVSLYFKKTVGLNDILYTRDFMIMLLFSKKVFMCLELHDMPKSNFLFKWAIKKPKLFFVLNKNLKSELVKMGVEEDKIYISPSGVDIEKFNVAINKEKARASLNLPTDKKIVMYSGQLYSWKGADTLADAASLTPEANFVFVGGVEPELSIFEKKYGKAGNITVLPFQERGVIPTYLKAADVLVLPNSSKEQVSVRYTSPLKLFEYMASGRPIVASDLPSIREAVTEEECVFAEPDNCKSFADAVKKVLENKEFAETLAQRAFQKAAKYSWHKRAENILYIIRHELSN